MHPLVIAILVLASLGPIGFAKEIVPQSSSKLESTDSDTVSHSRAKRGWDFRRLGRGLQMLRLGKRADLSDDFDAEGYNDDAPFYSSFADDDHSARLRRSSPPSADDVASPVVVDDGEYLVGDFDFPGYLSTEEDADSELMKRNLAMLRLGKRQLPMLRLGRSGADDFARRIGLRLGKRPATYEPLDDEVDSDMVDPYDMDKRNLHMLRLGKRSLSMLRLGKRSRDTYEEMKRNLGMLRLGKRSMNQLRLGKRNLAMLRLGKRADDIKRNLMMLRLGKRAGGFDKKNLAMLRLGKRDGDSAKAVASDKRNLNILRLGKRNSDGSEKANQDMLGMNEFDDSHSI